MAKKPYAVLSKAAIATLLVSVASTSVVFAKTDAILTKDSTGKYFQYDLTQLTADAVNNALGLPAPLFNDYASKTLVAFHDDNEGYIDSEKVNDAAVEAVLEHKQFVLDDYTENPPAGAVEQISGTVQTRIVETGTDGQEQVADGDVINPVETVKVDTVTAVDGTITVKLTKAPATAPVVGDFAVTKSVVVGSQSPVETTVVPTAVDKDTTDATGLTYKLTVPTIAATADDQAVTYKVDYKTTGVKEAAPYTVGKIAVVSSVSAATTTILPAANVDTSKYKLSLNYLDKDGNVISADKLPSDLTVSFTDNKAVFNTDGTIKTKGNIPASGDITVVAAVTSASQNVNLTKEFKVSVVAASGWSEVTDSAILFNTDVQGKVLALGDTAATLVPTAAKQNDGTVLFDKDVDPTDNTWIGNVKSVESSNIKVLSANTNGTTVNLVPISAGTSTVTVTLNSGYKYTKTIEVESEARQAASVTTDKAKAQLTSTVTTDTVKLTVLDQYGDPSEGTTVYAYPAKTGDSAIAQNTSATTDKKGEANLVVTAAASAVTGSDTIKLSVDADADKDGIGSLPVEYAKAGDVTSYELRIASDSESTDATIDKYDTKDDALKLQFVGKDANGVLAKVYDQTTVGSTYTVSSSDTTIATAAVAGDGTIDITPVKAGDTTITVKEGNIVRATFAVKVTDSTPSLGTISVLNDAQFTANASKSYTLDLSKLIEIGNFTISGTDVKDGTTKIGSVQVLLSDGTTVTGTTFTTPSTLNKDSNVSLIFKLVDLNNNVIDVQTLPVTFDNTAPTVSNIKVNGQDVTITGGVIDLKAATSDATVPVTSSTATLSENVTASYGGVTKDFKVGDAFSVLSPDSQIDAATVSALDGATITLTDAAGNATTYTLDTK